MKYKYSKFNGFDVSSINLGELTDSMSDALLDSGYDDDYYWTRQRKLMDTSLDALRRALLHGCHGYLLDSWFPLVVGRPLGGQR